MRRLEGLDSFPFTVTMLYLGVTENYTWCKKRLYKHLRDKTLISFLWLVTEDLKLKKLEKKLLTLKVPNVSIHWVS